MTYRFQKFIIFALILISFLTINSISVAQPNQEINWITFEQLEDSLKVNPKKVFVDFVADWCQVCKAMEENVFTDSLVITTVNRDYYAVRMNIESPDTIAFGNQTFINERLEMKNPIHQIPLLMASRKDKPFSLPAMVFFDERFIATSRYFQFIDAKQFVNIITKD